LDRDTSGVMVIAKSAIARASLKQQFFEHSIERVYEAIVLGAIRAPVSFDTLYNRHPTDRIKFSSRVSRGRRACTHVTPIESLGLDATRIECRLETGRTHQIRVHLSDAGHPLLGDPLYGRRPKDTALRSVSESLGRQALHARVLAFNHPLSGQRVRFERPPPEDFAVALAALRGRCTA
jgi:23S rRNA pseudouridine1911/1915/1917 synthase